MLQLIDSVVYNLLGEKAIGWKVGDIMLDSVFERTEEEKKEKLIPLQDLPLYIRCRDNSSVFINEEGHLVQK